MKELVPDIGKLNKFTLGLFPFLVLALLIPTWAFAQESGESVPFTKGMADAIAGYKVSIDTVWVLVAAMLVFFMNLGFARSSRGFAGLRMQ